MSNSFTQLTDQEVGERLRVARDRSKLTQAEAAEKVRVARTTLVAIEKGLRKVRPEEIVSFAEAYGTSANILLRPESVQVDLAPRFRKLQLSTDDAVITASRLLIDLVAAETELENALGIRRSRNFPPETPILPGDVEAQAESSAQSLRAWLGLGPGPIHNLISMMELQIGIRVYARPLDWKISGLFACDDSVGACVLLNSLHPRERQIQSAAHELGHFMSARSQIEVFVESSFENSREERFARQFARSFLTPARAVGQMCDEIIAGNTHLVRRHVILLAHAFSVSREAIVRRLEELKIVKDGTWQWFEDNGRITGDHVKEVLGDTYQEPVSNGSILPQRLSMLASEAWRRGIYSEGQLSKLLQLDRITLRGILDAAESEEDEMSEQSKFLF